MNAPMDLMHTLAWSLLHFLWQGAAIAALAAALYLVFRKPATRYLIGVSALGLMMLSFAVTFTLLGSAPELPANAPAVGASAAALSPAADHSTPSPLAWIAAPVSTESAPDFAWLARGWLVGVFILALRIAFGLFVIEQLRRRNLVALPDAWVARFQALQARLGLERGIRYAQCSRVSVPAVIGFFRPVVLIPMRALTGLSPEQLEALIAHELGHIKRFDVAVNFVQVIAETLFFFHPAVWWLNRRIRADREDCCDDIAVAVTGSSVSYAKSLATIARWHAVPDFAMAATGGPVAARVARLLGITRNSGNARTAGVFTASLVLAGALTAGALSLTFSDEASANPVPVKVDSAVPSPALAPAPVAAAQPASFPNPASPPAPVAAATPAARPAREARPAPAARPAQPDEPTGPAARADREPPAPEQRRSYLDEIRTADLGELDVDELIALKSQDVTLQYIQGIRAAGLRPDVDQFVAMKIHGVTPDYVAKVRAMGYEVDVDELIAFKVHDVSPEFVQAMRGMGFNANVDEIVALKVQGVTADYVKGMRDFGYRFDTDQLIAMKVHDITPDYARQMKANGFDVSNVDELVAMKVHGVTPDYRKALQSAGFSPNTDDVIQAKVMDITPEFIAKVRSHGFKDLSLDKLIALKHADVF